MEGPRIYESVLTDKEAKHYNNLKKWIYRVGIGGIVIGVTAYATSALINYIGGPEAAISVNNVIGSKALLWGGVICASNFMAGQLAALSVGKPSDLEISTKPKTNSIENTL
jgi:hypothetical protein